jgi:hypothetical protein
MSTASLSKPGLKGLQGRETEVQTVETWSYCHVFMAAWLIIAVFGLDLLTPSCTLTRNHKNLTITHNKWLPMTGSILVSLYFDLNYDWLLLASGFYWSEPRVRVTLRLAVYRQSVRPDDNSLRLTTSNFIFQLNSSGYIPYVTISLTRGWVYRWQLLLVLASAIILGFESSMTHDDILPSQIRDSPNLEDRVPVFISPRNGVARL